MIAGRMGIDVREVIRLATRHPRVDILQPSPGVGGHCIAVDPWFTVHGAPEKAQLILAAHEVNLDKTAHVIARAAALIKSLPHASVACLELAFKPNIDDFREGPAIEVAAQLSHWFIGCICLVEPFARTLLPEIEGWGAWLIGLDTARSECEILIVLVDDDVVKAVSSKESAGKAVYDTRGIW